jgi:D-sedoheptulose 7-phosphate isomerase
MESIDQALADAATLGDWLRRAERDARVVSRFAARLSACLRDGHRVLACGNGGSMSDAMHFAEELTARFRDDRPALAAQAMSDPGHLTCVANDFGFERVFARGVEAWGRAGDTLVVFSTSGNSPNLIAAAEAAHARDMAVAGLLGRDGGRLVALCDDSIVVPGKTPDRIQEVHIQIVHLVIAEIERALFGAGVTPGRDR